MSDEEKETEEEEVQKPGLSIGTSDCDEAEEAEKEEEKEMEEEKETEEAKREEEEAEQRRGLSIVTVGATCCEEEEAEEEETELSEGVRVLGAEVFPREPVPVPPSKPGTRGTRPAGEDEVGAPRPWAPDLKHESSDRERERASESVPW